MPRPEPQEVRPDEVRDLALTLVRKARFPSLATMDGGQPRVRPVSPVRVDGFTVYVANLSSYHKTAELAANPRVELAHVDEQHDQVRITTVNVGER